MKPTLVLHQKLGFIWLQRADMVYTWLQRDDVAFTWLHEADVSYLVLHEADIGTTSEVGFYMASKS